MHGRFGTLPLCLLLAVACSEPEGVGPPPSDPGLVYDLVDYLPVASVEDLAPGAHADSPFVAGDGRVAQRIPSRATFYFAIPPGCRLVARGVVRLAGARNTGVRGRLSIDVMEESKHRRAPLVHDLGGPPEIELAADLSDLSGKTALVRVSAIGFTPPDTSATIEWERLQIRRDVGPPPPRSELPRRPYNVFVVLLDTLRADYTQPYGNPLVKTPTLERLAAEGVTFESALANSSWTLPSVASVITGTYPSLHGITTGDEFSEATVLSGALPTLAELLHARGYRSVAVLNNPIIHPRIGLTRGFDDVYAYYQLRPEVLHRDPRTPEAEADFVWESYLAKTIESRDGSPFLAFVHELDPHYPFHPPPPYEEMYGPMYPGDVAALRRPDLPNHYQADPSMLDTEAMLFLKRQYAGEISFMDHYLGRLLERLADAGHEQDTLVVFLSDHGEGLGQHRRLSHGNTLYDEVLRVPLILRLPAALPRGVRVQGDVELVDVLPTVLDLVGVPIPDDSQGRSLLPWIAEPEGPRLPRPLFAKTLFLGRFEIDSVRYGRWKLVLKHMERERASDGTELYDLHADPGEHHDVARTNPIVVNTLRQMIAWRERLDRERGLDVEMVDLDETELARLQALGYVESKGGSDDAKEDTDTQAKESAGSQPEAQTEEAPNRE